MKGVFCWWQNLGHYRQLAVGGWACMGLFLWLDLAKGCTWSTLSGTDRVSRGAGGPHRSTICLSEGNPPVSLERSKSRSRDLLLFLISPPFGCAHPFSSHPSTHHTAPSRVPTSPTSCVHPPMTSLPISHPVHLSTHFHTHPVTRSPPIYPSTASVHPFILHVCTLFIPFTPL